MLMMVAWMRTMRTMRTMILILMMMIGDADSYHDITDEVNRSWVMTSIVEFHQKCTNIQLN